MVVLIVTAAPAGLAAQEVMYVTDILRLGLHRNADTSDSAFRVLVSGTELAILDRATNYAHVRLTDGTEGWVKSAYLVDDKPAQLRVSELEAAQTSLSEELAGAQQALKAKTDELDEIQRQANEANSDAGRDQVTMASLQAENNDYRERLTLYSNSLPVRWITPALVVFLIIGFLLGVWFIDYRSRKKHGGFRIY